MSLRTLIRLLSLALACLPLSLLLWDTVGLLPLLVGLGLLLGTFGYLVLLAGEGDLTRWQLRYHLPAGTAAGDLAHLEAILRFLASRAGHLVLEANARGLFLELPAGFEAYVEAQFPRALPEVRLLREECSERRLSGSPSFFCIGLPGSELLRWATEGEGRQVRLHIHHGPCATLAAQTEGARPRGAWLRVPVPHPMRRIWQRLPVWDELSAGTRLSRLFPITEGDPAYSSRSRLLKLTPPASYHAGEADRALGRSTDGRALTLSHHVPLFTVGAPASFLTRQVLGDLEIGRAVILVSPHRRLLEWIGRQATEAPVYWLDSQNSHHSAHLALVGAEEWEDQEIEGVVQATQTFLTGLGMHIDLPAVGDFTHQLVEVLACHARTAKSPLSFSDLYTVSQSTQALRAFLAETQGGDGDSAQRLLARLDGDAGYVQAVTVLSALRNELKPLASGPFQALCQPPFLNTSQLLREKGLLLVPMTNADFPEHDRLLNAMLDLTLSRLLATGTEVRLAVHLHDPHLYRDDRGQRWIQIAREDPRLSLVLDVHDPEAYAQVEEEGQEAEILFRCSEPLASSLIADWNLPASITDLTELPNGTAIGRLRGMVVALEVDKDE